jgi:S-DNA-T family DNA segregation ATPase FtsK/SpoIIIE
MVDPKMVELAAYHDLPHMLTPVVTDVRKAAGTLNWLVSEMERRYQFFATCGTRNIQAFNHRKANEAENPDIPKKIPYIVLIIDELADLMVVAQDKVETAITRLAQLSRAVGIHLILATQRPSVDVITGVIKANFPARISFKVASKVDSRTVLDMNGADKLLGKGDMLFLRPGDPKPTRGQATFISDEEINSAVSFIKSQQGPQYLSEVEAASEGKSSFRNMEKDEMYDEAVRVVLETRQASVSVLQRKLRLGYGRAARIVDMMEEEGIVGPYQGSKPREILIDRIPEASESASNES